MLPNGTSVYRKTATTKIQLQLCGLSSNAKFRHTVQHYLSQRRVRFTIHRQIGTTAIRILAGHVSAVITARLIRRLRTRVRTGRVTFGRIIRHVRLITSQRIVLRRVSGRVISGGRLERCGRQSRITRRSGSRRCRGRCHLRYTNTTLPSGDSCARKPSQ